jgi:hypothetical protein
MCGGVYRDADSATAGRPKRSILQTSLKETLDAVAAVSMEGVLIFALTWQLEDVKARMKFEARATKGVRCMILLRFHLSLSLARGCTFLKGESGVVFASEGAD